MQGSNIEDALTLAYSMLKRSSNQAKHIILLSDGGFDPVNNKHIDPSITIDTLGFGSDEGAPIPNSKGAFLRVDGQVILSSYHEAPLKHLSDRTGGLYQKAHFTQDDSHAILSNRHPDEEKTQTSFRIWTDHIAWFIVPMMLLMLRFFRPGIIYVFLLCSLFQSNHAYASDWFSNPAQQGQKALEQENYDQAFTQFSDPYRKAVASYLKQDFTKAIALFRANTREEVAHDALYNLGNSYAMQGQLDQAIASYKTLLTQVPNHTDATHNLALLEELRKDQKKDPSSQQNKEKQNEPKEQQENEESQAKPDNMDASEQTISQPEESPEPSIEEQAKWLDAIDTDPKELLRRQFYLKEKTSTRKRVAKPW
jgi:Ca-activated chloride channel family protein